MSALKNTETNHPVASFSLVTVFLLLGTSAFSQTGQAASAGDATNFSNPLFIVFATVIVFLLLVIVILADVVKGAAKIMLDKKKKSSATTIALLLLTIGYSANAQTTVADLPTTYGGLSQGMFYTLSFILVFEIFVIASLLTIIRNLLGIPEMKQEAAETFVASIVREPSIMEKLNASVPLEKEADVLLDHNYDGIQELDNNLPPWWKYGFYLTILFACIYLLNYHVLKTGDLQGTEYTKELAQASVDIAAYQKKMALSVDENSVKMLSDNASLEKGKEIFINNCVACHGKFGEGQVGPNFTDDYWIHGGKINDLFKTIKYGIPEKGMKSWKEDLSPSQISFVSSYIKTLRGTNPPNPKEKQGELYLEKDTNSAAINSTDTTKNVLDSLALSKK